MNRKQKTMIPDGNTFIFEWMPIFMAILALVLLGLYWEDFVLPRLQAALTFILKAFDSDIRI